MARPLNTGAPARPLDRALGPGRREPIDTRAGTSVPARMASRRGPSVRQGFGSQTEGRHRPPPEDLWQSARPGVRMPGYAADAPPKNCVPFFLSSPAAGREVTPYRPGVRHHERVGRRPPAGRAGAGRRRRGRRRGAGPAPRPAAADGRGPPRPPGPRPGRPVRRPPGRAGGRPRQAPGVPGRAETPAVPVAAAGGRGAAGQDPPRPPRGPDPGRRPGGVALPRADAGRLQRRPGRPPARPGDVADPGGRPGRAAAAAPGGAQRAGPARPGDPEPAALRGVDPRRGRPGARHPGGGRGQARTSAP